MRIRNPWLGKMKTIRQHTSFDPSLRLFYDPGARAALTWKTERKMKRERTNKNWRKAEVIANDRRKWRQLLNGLIACVPKATEMLQITSPENVLIVLTDIIMEK